MVPIWPDDHVAQLIEHFAVQRPPHDARHVLEAFADRRGLAAGLLSHDSPLSAAPTMRGTGKKIQYPHVACSIQLCKAGGEWETAG
jgi:hypothetical protein